MFDYNTFCKYTMLCPVFVVVNYNDKQFTFIMTQFRQLLNLRFCVLVRFLFKIKSKDLFPFSISKHAYNCIKSLYKILDIFICKHD